MADVHPHDQLVALVADARQAFARDVDALLVEFEASYAPHAVISRDDWRGLRRTLLEKFDQRVPLKSTADPKLLQLVREAFELLNDDDSSLSIREWTSEARKVLTPEETIS